MLGWGKLFTDQEKGPWRTQWSGFYQWMKILRISFMCFKIWKVGSSFKDERIYSEKSQQSNSKEIHKWLDYTKQQSWCIELGHIFLPTFIVEWQNQLYRNFVMICHKTHNTLRAWIPLMNPIPWSEWAIQSHPWHGICPHDQLESFPIRQTYSWMISFLQLSIPRGLFVMCSQDTL